ncbi:Protein kinase [Coemansia biformis]|uniref:non-specific serine/threonine protein kinase n=1 Tax=Coemansia biformis TaxID=1286918 RepID=A0A9W8D172_9FUNG|nr:Protein kinase [Coemansia biformis]
MSGKQTIGNYTVMRTLGVGSFGKVKLAVHSQTSHKVALKIIGRSKLAHSDMVGRVNREIQYLKMLRHPHIIKLYEVITTPTDIIMVIEYAGGELFNYIVERGRMSEKDARRFFQQLVSAVEYCHRRNIVHRDLKPENVLLDPYDNVKVADFGLSNIMKDGEFLQTSCGSPNYAAPEVINGKLYAGPEVDAWSCGVILYVMLCGRLPFDDDHIPALFKKITSGVFTMPGYLSQGARSVLSGLLQVDPLTRMTLAQVRQHPWFTTDLPEYLKPLPESTDIEGLAVLDDSIVGELERQLEMDRRSLVAQLRQRGTNPAKVAYQLYLDNRHMLEQSRNSNKQGIRNFALASSPPAAFQIGNPPEARDRAGSTGNAIPSPLLGGSVARVRNDDDDDSAPSGIGILGSSLPSSAGHVLESQMYKMRLRGPNAQTGSGAASTATPRVQSPLVPSQQQQQQQQKTSWRPDSAITSGAAAVAQQALGSVGNSPASTPPNYFRAALPPLAGTPGMGNQSNSSSISSLAHASLKAPPTSNNPYSHRTDSANMSGITGGDSAADADARPVSDGNDVEMQPESGGGDGSSGIAGSPATARRPTVMRKRAKTTRTRWHFGIRSRSPPADVMAEVYRALQQLGMTWKHFNPYHLRAKYTRPGMGGDGQEAVEVKIDLQLFKLDSRDNYLVDFKAVIPSARGIGGGEQGSDAGFTYRAGQSTLISPMPPFIQAARRRMSAAPRPATFVDHLAGGSFAHMMAMDGGGKRGLAADMEPRSLDDQFLESNYPIQLPAEVPVSSTLPFAVGADRSDMLPRPETLPARSVQRFVGGAAAVAVAGSAMEVDQADDQESPGVSGSTDSMSVSSGGHQGGGIPIPEPAGHTRAVDIPSRKLAAGSIGVGSVGSPGHTMGGTPRSQGRAPGSYMPGSVVGRVSLARADVSLTADGVGAGNGPSHQAQERVVNIFPFLDVCCRLITELAVPHR